MTDPNPATPVTPPEDPNAPDAVDPTEPELADPTEESEFPEGTNTRAETPDEENERLRRENDKLQSELHNLRGLVGAVGNPGETQVSPDDDDYDPREGVPAVFMGATGHNTDEDVEA